MQSYLKLPTAKSSVKLTPDAFIEPYLYTGVKETELKVQQYKDYLSGERSTNPGLKVHGERQTIHLTLS